jgi:N-carbamoyl-L-amino-acid hydrolase
MQAAGLSASIDGIGNVFGKSAATGRKILAGSHIESQNRAGWLDGALGVIYALEAARAIGEDAALKDVGVDVIAFFDEEGHFGSFLGSRSFIGDVTEDEIDAAKDTSRNLPLRHALADAGYAGRPRLQIERNRYAGFFEAHIEQGRTLETAKLKIGVVTAIVGLWDYRIRIVGQQNHAGTTTMQERRDAGLTMVRLIAALDRFMKDNAGPRTVWTCGIMQFEPGARSIIPGEARANFQFRDTDLALLEKLEAGLVSLVEEFDRDGPCRASVEVVRQSSPALMDEGLLQALDESAREHAPDLWIRMPSGAGHDSQHMARILPAAMLFVPSIGGISHHWSENTSDEDIVLGAQVFAGAIARVLSR